MKHILKIATEQELRLYKKNIYPLQDFVCSLLADNKDIYLTGGTALTRFYFQHRLSEDLDFFIRVGENDTLETIDLQKRTDTYAKDLAGKLMRKFDIADEWHSDTYSRFYVNTDVVSLKIDFVREYRHIGTLKQQPSGFYVNNLQDMGAGKIAAFEERCEIKDIVDLFYLTKQIPLPRLFELADLKRVPISYEHLLTINIQGISGVALMLQEIDSSELTRFISSLKYHAEFEIKKKRNTSAQT